MEGSKACHMVNESSSQYSNGSSSPGEGILQSASSKYCQSWCWSTGGVSSYKELFRESKEQNWRRFVGEHSDDRWRRFYRIWKGRQSRGIVGINLFWHGVIVFETCWVKCFRDLWCLLTVMLKAVKKFLVWGVVKSKRVRWGSGILSQAARLQWLFKS